MLFTISICLLLITVCLLAMILLLDKRIRKQAADLDQLIAHTIDLAKSQQKINRAFAEELQNAVRS